MKFSFLVLFILASAIVYPQTYSGRVNSQDNSKIKFSRHDRSLQYRLRRQKAIDNSIIRLENELSELKKEKAELKKEINALIDRRIKDRNEMIDRIKEEQQELKKMKDHSNAGRKAINKKEKNDKRSESINNEINELKELKSEIGDTTKAN